MRLLDYNADIEDGDACPHCALAFEEYSSTSDRCAGKAPNEPGIIECQSREITLLKARRSWTRTATELPRPGVWLMGTVPGREYPMLVRLKVDGAEPCWETRTGDTTPLAACSHWDYFEPLEADES